MNSTKSYPKDNRFNKRGQRILRGQKLLQVAMPLGGIGAGSICMNGYGGLQDFSIRNHPSTTAIDEANIPTDAAFALLYIKGIDQAKLVEGPLPVEKIYDQGIKAQGNQQGGHEGLPRFLDCTFQGEYPFGHTRLSDPTVPLKIRINGFNPFIPLDDKNSSIPCVILEYTLENTSKSQVEFEFSYHLSHLAPGAGVNQSQLYANADSSKASRNQVIPGVGVFFSNDDDPQTDAYGSAALGVIGHEPLIKAMWYRGGWFDSISALWREVSTGCFRPNDGHDAVCLKGRNGGSIMLSGKLGPGESITYPIVITWYFPNVHLVAGGEDACTSTVFAGPAVRTCQCHEPAWRPYYVSQWQDAHDVLRYVCEHYPKLRSQTEAFHDSLFSSTLPDYVLDAVSANLAILKSPTVLREENGNLWAWEGCFCEHGCCYGSCTHVWNYAQALPHLFPQLERTLREQEYERSMDDAGHINFRSALPDGPTHHSFHAAADGQLGGIMKLYREWQISGDLAWLKRMYPKARRSMDYAIHTWDPGMKGVIEEPHHNTYDIEFWGPDGMHSSFYLGALTAMVALANESGHPEDGKFYAELAKRGVDYCDRRLWNGEYYEQKVTYRGLRDNSFASFVANVTDDSPEEDQLLRAEGPKYQYSSGCISDGVMGAWLARMCGVETMQTREKIRTNLQAIFKYNFKTSLREHANTQRPGYAIGDEPGLLLCTWPKGGKPTLPFVYSDEVWTGIEYQVASHLISEGMVDEGLTIVKAVRSRYEGHTRNPWNEYECGSYYARAMASYALLPALSGFRYSMPEKRLYFEPNLDLPHFRVFFSTAGGWGTISLSKGKLSIDLRKGELVINSLVVTSRGKRVELTPKITATAGKISSIQIP